MLLALVKAAVEEIAWEGPPGISWGDLVQRLTEHGFEMDSYIKEALWTELTCKPPTFVRRLEWKHVSKPQQSMTDYCDSTQVKNHCFASRGLVKTWHPSDFRELWTSQSLYRYILSHAHMSLTGHPAGVPLLASTLRTQEGPSWQPTYLKSPSPSVSHRLGVASRV